MDPKTGITFMSGDLHHTTDPKAIATLHVRGLAEQGKQYAPEEVIEKWRSVADCSFILARTSGFIAFQAKNSEACYISDLYVEPAARGQGIARQLIRAVTSRHQHIDLHVDASNEIAVSLYRSEGFVAAPVGDDNTDPRMLMSFRRPPAR